MKHYFRVVRADDGSKRLEPKKKNFILKWLSGLGISGWLILINLIMFFLFSIFMGLFGIEKYIFLQPYNLFANGYFWTLLTSMFMHANFLHLFINMLSLFFIGRFLEMIIGKSRFFWLYLIGGIFAGLFFASFSFLFGNSGIGERIFLNSETFAVGASGAIFAIAGVLCFLTPKTKVYLIAGPILAIIIQVALQNFVSNSFYNLINIVVSVYIFLAIFSMFSINLGFRAISLPIKMSFWLLPILAIVPLIIIGLIPEMNLPIGNTAHLGGFIAGAFYGFYLRIKYKNKVRAISRHFSN